MCRLSLERTGLTCGADVAHGLLHKAHVATVAGEGFGTTEHVRFSYATTMENLDKALERMRKYFGERKLSDVSDVKSSWNIYIAPSFY